MNGYGDGLRGQIIEVWAHNLGESSVECRGSACNGSVCKWRQFVQLFWGCCCISEEELERIRDVVERYPYIALVSCLPMVFYCCLHGWKEQLHLATYCLCFESPCKIS